MHLYSKENGHNSYEAQMTNFHDFTSAVGTVFLTINFVWYECFSFLYGPQNDFYILSFYNITLIFFGHLIVLNLFIALMLRGFENSEEIDKEEEKLEKKGCEQKNLAKNGLKEKDSESSASEISIKDVPNLPSLSSLQNSSNEISSENLEQDEKSTFGFKFLFFFACKNKKLFGSLLKTKRYRNLMIFMIMMTMASLAIETYDIDYSLKVAMNLIINLYFLLDLLLNALYFGLFEKKVLLVRNALQAIEIFIFFGVFLELFLENNEHIIITVNFRFFV